MWKSGSVPASHRLVVMSDGLFHDEGFESCCYGNIGDAVCLMGNLRLNRLLKQAQCGLRAAESQQE